MLTPKDIKLVAKNISSRILNHTIVIYFKQKNKYVVYCNGILFRENGKAYIITAEHVFSNMQPGDLKIFQNGSFCFLEGDIIGNQNYDISLFEIDKAMESCLSENYTFINRNKLLFDHQPESKQKYLLIGYPSSKTKIIGYNISEKPIVYQTAALNTQPNTTEILFGYNKRKSRKYDQNGFFFAPDPYGLSGSGLWHITSFVKNIEYELVGIFKEFDWKKNIGTATRIDCLREILK